tara:strand:- start:261 stop:374 length:114 start_codon:yes stop_codon:yes gene_type:complete
MGERIDIYLNGSAQRVCRLTGQSFRECGSRESYEEHG